MSGLGEVLQCNRYNHIRRMYTAAPLEACSGCSQYAVSTALLKLKFSGTLVANPGAATPGREAMCRVQAFGTVVRALILPIGASLHTARGQWCSRRAAPVGKQDAEAREVGNIGIQESFRSAPA